MSRLQQVYARLANKVPGKGQQRGSSLGCLSVVWIEQRPQHNIDGAPGDDQVVVVVVVTLSQIPRVQVRLAGRKTILFVLAGIPSYLEFN